MANTPEPTLEIALLEYGIIEENGCYSLRVDATTNQGFLTKTVHAVTPELPRAIALLGLLWKQGVSPVNLQDVLTDLGVLEAK